MMGRKIGALFDLLQYALSKNHGASIDDRGSAIAVVTLAMYFSSASMPCLLTVVVRCALEVRCCAKSAPASFVYLIRPDESKQSKFFVAFEVVDDALVPIILGDDKVAVEKRDDVPKFRKFECPKQW